MADPCKDMSAEECMSFKGQMAARYKERSALGLLLPDSERQPPGGKGQSDSSGLNTSSWQEQHTAATEESDVTSVLNKRPALKDLISSFESRNMSVLTSTDKTDSLPSDATASRDDPRKVNSGGKLQEDGRLFDSFKAFAHLVADAPSTYSANMKSAESLSSKDRSESPMKNVENSGPERVSLRGSLGRRVNTPSPQKEKLSSQIKKGRESPGPDRVSLRHFAKKLQSPEDAIKMKIDKEENDMSDEGIRSPTPPIRTSIKLRSKTPSIITAKEQKGRTRPRPASQGSNGVISAETIQSLKQRLDNGRASTPVGHQGNSMFKKDLGYGDEIPKCEPNKIKLCGDQQTVVVNLRDRKRPKTSIDWNRKSPLIGIKREKSFTSKTQERIERRHSKTRLKTPDIKEEEKKTTAMERYRDFLKTSSNTGLTGLTQIRSSSPGCYNNKTARGASENGSISPRSIQLPSTPEESPASLHDQLLGMVQHIGFQRKGSDVSSYTEHFHLGPNQHRMNQELPRTNQDNQSIASSRCHTEHSRVSKLSSLLKESSEDECHEDMLRSELKAIRENRQDTEKNYDSCGASSVNTFKSSKPKSNKKLKKKEKGGKFSQRGSKRSRSSSPKLKSPKSKSPIGTPRRRSPVNSRPSSPKLKSPKARSPLSTPKRMSPINTPKRMSPINTPKRMSPVNMQKTMPQNRIQKKGSPLNTQDSKSQTSTVKSSPRKTPIPRKLRSPVYNFKQRAQSQATKRPKSPKYAQKRSLSTISEKSNLKEMTSNTSVITTKTKISAKSLRQMEEAVPSNLKPNAPQSPLGKKIESPNTNKGISQLSYDSMSCGESPCNMVTQPKATTPKLGVHRVTTPDLEARGRLSRLSHKSASDDGVPSKMSSPSTYSSPRRRKFSNVSSHSNSSSPEIHQRCSSTSRESPKSSHRPRYYKDYAHKTKRRADDSKQVQHHSTYKPTDDAYKSYDPTNEEKDFQKRTKCFHRPPSPVKHSELSWSYRSEDCRSIEPTDISMSDFSRFTSVSQIRRPKTPKIDGALKEEALYRKALRDEVAGRNVLGEGFPASGSDISDINGATIQARHVAGQDKCALIMKSRDTERLISDYLKSTQSDNSGSDLSHSVDDATGSHGDRVDPFLNSEVAYHFGMGEGKDSSPTPSTPVKRNSKTKTVKAKTVKKKKNLGRSTPTKNKEKTEAKKKAVKKVSSTASFKKNIQYNDVVNKKTVTEEKKTAKIPPDNSDNQITGTKRKMAEKKLVESQKDSEKSSRKSPKRVAKQKKSPTKMQPKKPRKACHSLSPKLKVSSPPRAVPCGSALSLLSDVSVKDSSVKRSLSRLSHASVRSLTAKSSSRSPRSPRRIRKKKQRTPRLGYRPVKPVCTKPTADFPTYSRLPVLCATYPPRDRRLLHTTYRRWRDRFTGDDLRHLPPSQLPVSQEFWTCLTTAEAVETSMHQWSSFTVRPHDDTDVTQTWTLLKEYSEYLSTRPSPRRILTVVRWMSALLALGLLTVALDRGQMWGVLPRGLLPTRAWATDDYEYTCAEGDDMCTAALLMNDDYYA